MTPRNKDASPQGHDGGRKGGEGGAAHGECGCTSLGVQMQLTESTGVDVNNKFSWCSDFNHQVCRGDGS